MIFRHPSIATMNTPLRPEVAQQATPAKLLMGLIGAGIQRSLTPAMQEEEARQQGLRLHYQLIDLDAAGATPEVLPALIEAARVMGYAGLNVTFPCKQTVIPLLDGLSDEAAAIGAVNTVVCRGGRLVGHNTDCSGWTFGFQRGLPDADLSRVVLLGAGGAGAAIAHAVMRLGARQLVVVDQDMARAADLVGRLDACYGTGRAHAQADVALAMNGASGLIHATPTGMDKLPGLPLPAELLQPQMWVSEVVYFPLETELLKVARAKGCRTVDGGGMAVGQAVGAFELVMGLKADAERMQQHFLRLIGQRTAA
jgi:shikimate dehydrogenase